MPTGIVKKFFVDKGFGFIQPDDGGDEVFVHRKINEGEGGPDHSAYLEEGQSVDYEAEFDEKKGKYAAVSCTGFQTGGGGSGQRGGGRGAREKTGGEGKIGASRQSLGDGRRRDGAYGQERDSYGGKLSGKGCYGGGGKGKSMYGEDLSWHERNCAGEYNPVYARAGQNPKADNPYLRPTSSATRPTGKGKSKGKGKRMNSIPPISHEKLASIVHEVLAVETAGCVQSVAHLEGEWSPEEMTKRVVRYVYKGALTEELPREDWSKAVRQFVEKGIGAYTRVCHEKPWYLELDLGPAVGAASVTLSGYCGGYPPESEQEVEEFAIDIYKSQLHKSQVETILWETVNESLPIEEKPKAKFYNAVSKSYDKVFELVSSSNDPDEAAERFVKQWVTDSLTRSWHTVENSEGALTADIFVEFFTHLLTASDLVASCMPLPFQGDDSDDWRPFLQETIDDLFAQEAQEKEGPPTKKRKATQIEDEEY